MNAWRSAGFGIARARRGAAAALLAGSLVGSLVLGLAACPAEEPAPAARELMPAEAQLVRVAMALRGVRPSADELARVRDDASALDAIIDDYMSSAEFGATVREMHGEQLLTNVDPVFYPAGFRPLGALAGMDAQALNLSVVESPARLIEHVVMEDRPYHEIVTGDYAYADAVTAEIFGLPYDDAGPPWQETQFDDGRDAAGILSDNFLFTRHSSTYSNRNRGRANVVARALLCYDFLSREVELDADIDLADEDAVAHAIVENPSCVSCHQTLDPLAASFAPYFPIYVPTFLESYPFEMYTGALTSYMATADPAFFGTPSRGVRDIGILIAQDPRFSMCTARRFLAFFTAREPEALSIEEVSRYNDVFLAEGMSAKALVKAIVSSEDFLAADAPLLKTRPEQLARLVESTTGYRWKTNLPFDFGTGNIGEVDLMTDAFFGFKVLAGGTDGQGVTRPSTTMNATATLSLAGLAAHAAPAVVAADFEAAPAERRLLGRVGADDTGESAVRAQLVDVARALYGEELSADDDAIDDAYSVFAGAAGAGAERAWTITLFAMLQDARIAYH